MIPQLPLFQVSFNLFVLLPLGYALFLVPSALCHVPCALCLVNCTLCFVPCALRLFFLFLGLVLCALCLVTFSSALCLLPCVLCLVIFSLVPFALWLVSCALCLVPYKCSCALFLCLYQDTSWVSDLPTSPSCSSVTVPIFFAAMFPPANTNLTGRIYHGHLSTGQPAYQASCINYGIQMHNFQYIVKTRPLPTVKTPCILCLEQL